MSNPDSRAITIVVTDNDAVLRARARTMFEGEGFRVVEAADGQAAVAAAEREHPALVLMAVELPGMNGLEACTTMHSLPGRADTAIVLTTQHEDTDLIHQAYQAGATDVISKPLNWTLLGYRTRLILQANQIGRAKLESESKLRALMRASPDTLLVIAKDGSVLERHSGPETRSFLHLAGRGQGTVFDALPGKLATQWRQQLAKVLQSGQAQSSEFRLPENGTTRYFETRMTPYIQDRVLVMLRDATKQGQATARVKQLALVDTLTGLRNRQCFLRGLAEAIRAAASNHTTLVVLCIDLDNFKRINDSLGHTVGDQLLKTIAGRLRACLRRDDFVARFGRSEAHPQLARLGGDEFTVILRDTTSPGDAENVGERITKALSKPIAHGSHEFVITASIGIATYPEDGTDSDCLVKSANVAMHQAKTAGGNGYCLCSGTMSVRSLERLELEDALRRAIANDDLELRYQPKLGLASGRVTGVEALVRWTHPERGPISPEKFIPLAEDAGLIVELSQWVLRTACRQIREWQEGPVGEISVAVNLSGQQFYDSDVHSVITEALTESSIKPSLLELELTESTLMQDADGTIDTLKRLKESGLSIAVDDFGTGYCSLSYLKKFPIDTLKMDRSFVAELIIGGDDASICTAIIALGHSLGLKVIAEGVERQDQLELLRAQGCDEIQGYYFAKPQPADITARFLLAHREQAADQAALVGSAENEQCA